MVESISSRYRRELIDQSVRLHLRRRDSLCDLISLSWKCCTQRKKHFEQEGAEVGSWSRLIGGKLGLDGDVVNLEKLPLARVEFAGEFMTSYLLDDAAHHETAPEARLLQTFDRRSERLLD